MDIIIRFAQSHETFRRPEIEALAELGRIDLKILDYNDKSPFALAAIHDEHDIKPLTRSLLAKSFYELWAKGTNYDEVHKDLKIQLPKLWRDSYVPLSFKFEFESFRSKRSQAEQRQLIDSFSYLQLQGPIKMKNPELIFCIMEEYDEESVLPKRIFLGRLISEASREIVEKYDVKKRHYIGTTTMDAELSLITANMAHAAPGTLSFDPLAGTGSFMIACSHFGAMAWGSDIDGRQLRGEKGRNVFSNFNQYGLLDLHGDCFISDLTHSPIRALAVGDPARNRRIFNSIVCDPPYGVREGLKVLGHRDPEKGKKIVVRDGALRHLQPDYIPPKRPYGFDAMLNDILHFAAVHLVDKGRLCVWVPTANEDLSPLAIPTHAFLDLKSSCVQTFNKWSRMLLTYQRKVLSEEEEIRVLELETEKQRIDANDFVGKTIDDLNNFRRKYFQGFKSS